MGEKTGRTELNFDHARLGGLSEGLHGEYLELMEVRALMERADALMDGSLAGRTRATFRRRALDAGKGFLACAKKLEEISQSVSATDGSVRGMDNALADGIAAMGKGGELR
jgi:hypothetical protein